MNLYEQKIDKLRGIVALLLDQVDYTNGACGPTEMVGAVLPVMVIENAKQVLRETL